MSKHSRPLRERILRHVAKSAPLTASQIAFDLSADPAKVKSDLEKLAESHHVIRRHFASGAPVYTLGPRGQEAHSARAPQTVPDVQRKPRMSGANFDKDFGRSHDIIVERRGMRINAKSSTGTPPLARHVLVSGEIAGGRQ